MRRLLLVLALLAVGCSDDAGPGPTTTTAVPTTTTTVPTTTSAAVTIEATRTCGPADGPAVVVEVTGVDARTVDLELQADGPPFVAVPYFTDRHTMHAHAGLGGLVTVARIREPDGGPVLAEDDAIDENIGGPCG